MTSPGSQGPSAFLRKRREPVSLSPENLVEAEPLLPGRETPLLIRPKVDGVSLPRWAQENRETVRGHLLVHGAVLFRGFSGIDEPADFEKVVQVIGGGELLRYSFASTPRTNVSGGIYTSTEYPPDQEIPLHNEMAYAREWPMKLGFHCMTAAREGGQTPLADSRRVYSRIPQDVRERFARLGVMYVRNYGEGLDLPWQEGFATEDKAEVDEFCRRAGIECTWLPGDGLRTRQVCQGVLAHPATGEPVWFNQAHLFHISNLPDEVRDSLLGTFAEQDLPRNAYYGDGSPIEASDLSAIRRIFREEEVAFDWRGGDVLMVENMLAAHGRRPFRGPRRILVGMAEQFSGTKA